MYEVKLNWENGNRETKTFDDYNEMLVYLADNADAGFTVFENGRQMNEADVARDVEMIAA